MTFTGHVYMVCFLIEEHLSMIHTSYVSLVCEPCEVYGSAYVLNGLSLCHTHAHTNTDAHIKCNCVSVCVCWEAESDWERKKERVQSHTYSNKAPTNKICRRAPLA